MTVERLSLKNIDPNPWQVRAGEDAMTVHMMAASIQLEGLLQFPAGRRDPNDKTRVQLAYGMTRLAAFQLLADHKRIDETDYDPEDYAAMPVDIRKMSDEDMARAAVVENAQRKDLSPIEQAKAMARLMGEFRMKRTAVARLFGYADPSTVSAKMALLRLPEGAQALVHKGELPERTARMLIHVARVDQALAVQTAKNIAGAKDLDEETVMNLVRRAMQQTALQLATPWDRDRAKGQWWKLDEEVAVGDALPAAKASEAISEIVGVVATMEFETTLMPGKEHTRPQIAKAAVKALRDGITTKELVELYGFPAEVVDRVAHMAKPPACTVCDFHALISGFHYCGLKPCMETKRLAMKAQALETVQRKRGLKGIELASRQDGEKVAYPGGSHYYSGTKVREAVKAIFDKALADKDPDLRLRQAAPTIGGEPYGVTNSPFVELVAVGGLAERVRKHEGERETDTGSVAGVDWKQRMEDQRIEQEIQDRIMRAAVSLFASAFKDVKGPAAELIALAWIGSDEDESGPEDLLVLPEGMAEMAKAERDAECQRRIARAFLDTMDRAYWTETQVEFLDLLAALGKRCGIELPEGWADEAIKGEPAEETPAEQEGQAQ